MIKRTRKNSRKESVCHPPRLNHAYGLCVSCYKKARRAKGGPSVERERARGREYQKQWARENPERARASHLLAGARWRARNQEHQYHYHLKRKYGLSVPRFKVMVLAQRNRCAICVEVFVGKPLVDHDHVTGAVRGLLCQPCNFLLGNAKDSKRRLQQAIEYLKRWRDA